MGELARGTPERSVEQPSEALRDEGGRGGLGEQVVRAFGDHIASLLKGERGEHHHRQALRRRTVAQHMEQAAGGNPWQIEVEQHGVGYGRGQGKDCRCAAGAPQGFS